MDDLVEGIMPCQHILSLMHHDLKIFVTEIQCTIDRGKGNRADIVRQQFEKFRRMFSVKIAAQLARGKMRAVLSTPDDTIELLPRIAEIKTVKVNDTQFAVFQHQISDMIIAVLKALRAILEQPAITLQIADDSVVVETDATRVIFFNFIICLTAKSHRPIFLRIRRRNRMNSAEYFAGFSPQHILLDLRQLRQNVRQIFTLDPTLQRKNAVLPSAKLDWPTHGNTESRHVPHHSEHFFARKRLITRSNAQQIFLASKTNCSVYGGSEGFTIH